MWRSFCVVSRRMIGLNDRHHGHVGISRQRHRAEQVRGELRGHEDGGRPIGAADDAHRRRFLKRERLDTWHKADEYGAEQRREDAELRGGAEQQRLRVRQQRAEVSQRAHAEENQRRKESKAHAGVEPVHHRRIGRVLPRLGPDLRVFVVFRDLAHEHAPALADRDDARRLKTVGQFVDRVHGFFVDHDRLARLDGAQAGDAIVDRLDVPRVEPFTLIDRAAHCPCVGGRNPLVRAPLVIDLEVGQHLAGRGSGPQISGRRRGGFDIQRVILQRGLTRRPVVHAERELGAVVRNVADQDPEADGHQQQRLEALADGEEDEQQPDPDHDQVRPVKADAEELAEARVVQVVDENFEHGVGAGFEGEGAGTATATAWPLIKAAANERE